MKVLEGARSQADAWTLDRVQECEPHSHLCSLMAPHLTSAEIVQSRIMSVLGIQLFNLYFTDISNFILFFYFACLNLWGIM